jgi:hypothetical protein
MAQTIQIAQASGASATVADITIDQIVLGSVTIGQLNLEGASLDLNSGSASLANVRIVLTLDFQFDWWINLGFWSDSGNADLGSLSFALDLGNVAIPSLGNIPLSVPNIALASLNAAIAPISSIDLGSGAFAGISATSVALPKNGFTLTGLGFGAISIAGIQFPEAGAAQLSFQQFHPNASIVFPSATLGPVQVPSAAAADVQTSAPVSFNGSASEQALSVSLGVLGGSINVTPTAFVSIGSLTLHGVALSGTVAQAILKNIGVPLDIHGINLNNIDIAQVTATGITL